MKAPWQLTRVEYTKAVMDGVYDFKLLGRGGDMASKLVRSVKWAREAKQNIDIAESALNKAIEGHHAAEVLSAFSDGLPVSLDVLRDYESYFKPEAWAEISKGTGRAVML